MAELNPIIIDEIFVARYAALKPELDRLEAENQRLSEAVAGYHRAAEADRAEIERLRQELSEVRTAIAQHEHWKPTMPKHLIGTIDKAMKGSE